MIAARFFLSLPTARPAQQKNPPAGGFLSGCNERPAQMPRPS
jgi:hypothetical protein